MDAAVKEIEARRLFVSAALTTHIARGIGGRVAADSEPGDLLDLSRNLDALHVERGHRIYFDPAYPGVTAGVEAVRGGFRLLLACRVFDHDGVLLGVVFTTLIPGRPPLVSVAPDGTPISEGWLPP